MTLRTLPSVRLLGAILMGSAGATADGLEPAYFKECPARPELAAAPVGKFLMGSPLGAKATSPPHGSESRALFSQLLMT